MAIKTPLKLKLEASGRPRDEYLHDRFRIQIDLHPDNHWTWMIEEETSEGEGCGSVYFHTSDTRPTYSEVQKWIAVQDWS